MPLVVRPKAVWVSANASCHPALLFWDANFTIEPGGAMRNSKFCVGGALLLIANGAAVAAGPVPVPPDAISRLATDVDQRTLVVTWGDSAAPGMRAVAMAAIQGRSVGSNADGTELIEVGVGMSDARSILSMLPGSVVADVEFTDTFVNNRLGLSSHRLEMLSVPGNTRQTMYVPIVIDDGLYTLELHPTSVRSPNFKIMVDDGFGRVVEAPQPPLTTYRGRVVEIPGSVVAASIEESMTARVLFSNNPEDGWLVEPLSSAVEGAPDDVYVVYHASEAQASDVGCGGDLLHEEFEDLHPVARSVNSTRSVPLVAEIAYEADYAFFQLNNSSEAETIADIESVQNGINAIYERDCGVTFVISEIIVRTSAAADPYTSTDPATLLGQFRSEWRTNYTGVERDTAHLMTGRDLNGSVVGIAWTSSLCGSYSYGVSQSRYTTNFNSRVAVTSHELGHVFSAQHCTGTDCHVMCAVLGGCGGLGLPSFGDTSIASITSLAASVSCLSSGPPENMSPSIAIGSPSNASRSDEDSSLFFSAVATDPEDGDISDNTVWTSNLDGPFATGNDFNYANLSVGLHTITASVSDSGGLVAEDSITLTIDAAPTPPDQPGQPTCTDLGDGSVRIDWSDLPDETLWDVQRQELVNLVWTNTVNAATALPADTVTYTDACDFGTFRYRVRARNDAGIGAWSDWRQVDVVDLNQPPTISISSPNNLLLVQYGDAIIFSVTALDPEDGNIGANTVWSSDLDGVFATGSGFSFSSLSIGNHTITASVSDSDGIVVDDVVLITVEEAPAPPDQPGPPTCTDLGDGSVRIDWSDLPDETLWDVQRRAQVDSVWTNAVNVAVALPADTITCTDASGPGTFRYRVRARNDAGYGDWSDWREIVVVDPTPNQAPSVSILSPADAITALQGETLSFAVSAIDPEDGDLGDSVVWTSNLDGHFGTGGSFTFSGLSVGTHTITASASDSEDLNAEDVITVVINEPMILPPQPGTPICSDLGDGVAGVQWSDLPNETVWDVQRQQLVGNYWTNTTNVAVRLPQNTTSHVDSCGDGYFRYRVRGRNDLGLGPWSDWCEIQVVHATNAAPTITITSPYEDQVVMAGEPLFFSVEASDAEDGDIADLTVWTSSLDGQFAVGTHFGYANLSVGVHTITAMVVDSGDLDAVATIRLIVTSNDVLPPAPAEPACTDLGNGTVRVTWTDLPNETLWDVQRQEFYGGVWTYTANVATRLPANTTSCIDPCGDGRFRYRVRARNAIGIGSWSAWHEITIDFGSTPNAPSNMAVADLGAGQYLCTWTDNSTNETMMQVQRQKLLSGNWVNDGTVVTLPANTVSYPDAPGPGTFRYRARSRIGLNVSLWTDWAVVNQSN